MNTDTTKVKDLRSNLSEKLALMKQLHDSGLEPRMWLDGGDLFDVMDTKEDGNHLHFSTGKGILPIWDSCCIDYNQPWFPLEQVLELLPEAIHIDKRRPICHLLSYGKVAGIFCCHYVLDFEFDIEAQGEDTHLAALQLLVQVLEKYPNEVKR